MRICVFQRDEAKKWKKEIGAQNMELVVIHGTASFNSILWIEHVKKTVQILSKL